MVWGGKGCINQYMSITKIKNKVREDVIVRLTFDGAFQRSKIYKKKISDHDRKEFRKYMAIILPRTINKIQKWKRYSDEDHYKTIEIFAKKVTCTIFNDKENEPEEKSDSINN